MTRSTFPKHVTEVYRARLGAIGKASRYTRAKTGVMTLAFHADYHDRTEAAYFGDPAPD